MFTQVADYSTSGQNPLAFTRTYNSFSNPGTYAVSMGGNWRHGYDRYLHVINPSAIYGVMAERPDGQVLSFSSNSGTYTSDSDVDYSLTVSGSTWTLTTPDDASEIYYSSGGEEGVLQSITQRNLYKQAIIYASGSQISYVSDSYGRRLGFTYSSTGNLTSVTTPDSLTLTYGYSSLAYTSTNQLTSVTYNTSPTTAQTYLYENASYPFALTGILNENGVRYASWGYDGNGRANLSQLALGADYTSITYDDSTGDRTVTGPLGIQETYKFATMQGVPKVVQIDRAANGTVAAASEYFTYDANGYLANVQDWDGNNTSYVNDSHGQPTQIVYASTTPDAQVTDITYDSTFPHLPATITQQGITTTLTYDASGNLLYRSSTDTAAQTTPYATNGWNRIWAFTWTGTGQLKTAQLPRTDATVKTTYAYTGGVLTSVTDALGHTTTVNTYQTGGLPLTVTDPNGVLTTLAYNTRNWLTSSVLSVSGGTLTTSFAYDSAGNLTRTTLPDSSYLAYGYDDANRVTSITNALSEAQAITYDSAGDVTEVLWKNASGVTKRQHSGTFDALGRMLTDVGGEGQTTAYSYDSNGSIVSITDPLSHIAYQSVDALNRVTAFTDAALNHSTIAYDSHSRVLTATDPKGNATSYVYDGFGDVIGQTSPDTLTSPLKYDSDSNLIQSTDAAGAVTNATYDALDRILTRTYPADSALNVAFTYDQAGHGFGVGRLTTMTDQAGTLYRYYDQRGNTIIDQRSPLTGGTLTSAFGYESAGRLSYALYPSGWSVLYGRDAAGQVSAAIAVDPSSNAQYVASSVTHMPFGPLASMTYGNGVTDTRTFDLDYRMTSVKDVGTGNIQYLSYGYDANDNVTSITDNVAAGNSQTLHYDAIDQISYASGPYGTVSSITYDSAGNRTAYGATGYTVPSGSNRTSAVGATGVSYISTGNISAIGADGLTYNKANQLSSATVSGTTSLYLYDGFGQRSILKDGSNPYTVEIVSPWGALLAEVNTSTLNETEYFYLDGMPLTVSQVVFGSTATNLSMLHTNNIDAPQKATDAAKNTVFAATYNPLGGANVTTSLIPQPLRQPGVHADATGFYHNGFRYQAPGAGLPFLQSDPIGLAGGQWSTYAAVGSNPYKNIDPTGTCGPLLPLCIVIAANPELTLLGLGVIEGLGYYAAGGIAPTSVAEEGALSLAGSAVAKGEMCSTAARPLPTRLARVVPVEFAESPTLAHPSAAEAFVTNASDIAGINTGMGLARRLTLVDSKGALIPGGRAIIEFDVPASGLASPILRANPGFVGKGLTQGGASEYTLPNLRLDELNNVTIRTVPP